LLQNWPSRYVGLPFKLNGRDRSGVDCYGLVCLIYKEQLSIELNPFKNIFIDHTPETLLKVASIMKKDRDNWIKGDSIQPFDMIQLRTGRHAFHVGVAIDSKTMIHIEYGIDCVIEKLTSPMWKNRVEWIYRCPI
jgi:cell wall-associated NlpC family hydrolase